MEKVIFKYVAGSHSYGTATSASDEDIRGIYLPSVRELMSPFCNPSEREGPGEDEKYYAINKFLPLYVKCNPNIVEFLWCDSSVILEATKEYDLLREHREALLCKMVANSFLGYATSRLKRIETRTTLPGSKRNELEKKFGYDTKDAMHLVRLMRMGVEILEGKGVIVKRPDADELMSIREGEWTIAKVFKHGKEMRERLRELEDSTTLPKEPQSQLAEDLMMRIYF